MQMAHSAEAARTLKGAGVSLYYSTVGRRCAVPLSLQPTTRLFCFLPGTN